MAYVTSFWANRSREQQMFLTTWHPLSHTTMLNGPEFCKHWHCNERGHVICFQWMAHHFILTLLKWLVFHPGAVLPPGYCTEAYFVVFKAQRLHGYTQAVRDSSHTLMCYVHSRMRSRLVCLFVSLPPWGIQYLFSHSLHKPCQTSGL